MRIAEILNGNRTPAMAVRPTETLRELAQRFCVEGVGAVIVRGENGSLDGIITERDVAHGLAVHGKDVHALSASALMTTALVACSPQYSIAEAAKVMMQRHMHYLPVKQCGRLIGIVGIGDVLKHRFDELRLEASVLRDIAIACR
jgi:signal-transduction protein with cAMP-binding, CBS, and nucleotidyltransferase domain